jgi:large subunit ribosomal protein L6
MAPPSEDGIVRVLKDEGYVADFRVEHEAGKSTLTVGAEVLRGRPVIDRLERVSRPGLRIYRGKDELPKVLGGMGTVIVSTPEGRDDGQAGAVHRPGRRSPVHRRLTERRYNHVTRSQRVIDLPQGVTATVAAEDVTVKGAKGSLSLPLEAGVSVEQEEKPAGENSRTRGRACRRGHRAHLANMILGVTKGYEKEARAARRRLPCRGAGQGLNLTLGFSHPVNYPIPEGITIENAEPDGNHHQGHRPQKVGQVAAEIRDVRPPEPYKGKGVRYAGEKIELKEGRRSESPCSIVQARERPALAPRSEDPRPHPQSGVARLSCTRRRVTSTRR